MATKQSRASVLRSIGRIFAPIVDLVYPPRCPLCGEATAEQGGLCGTCWERLIIPGQPACSTCSRPFPSDFRQEGASQCAQCIASPPKHSGISAATIYNDASRKLILAFKHGGKIALSRQMAKLMAAQVPDYCDALPLLVPVPLHRWRLWRRGYNQSALLARELGILGKGNVLLDGLVRAKRTPMLGGMTRKARERTLSGAIAVNRKKLDLIIGRDIILVDDVLTSGATSDACTRVLLRAGANTVSIACFARVMDELLHGEKNGVGSGKHNARGPKTPGAT